MADVNAFRTIWKRLMGRGEWVPQNYACHLAGVTTAAISKAIASGRLKTERVRINGREFVLVRLDQLERMGAPAGHAGTGGRRVSKAGERKGT